MAVNPRFRLLAFFPAQIYLERAIDCAGARNWAFMRSSAVSLTRSAPFMTISADSTPVLYTPRAVAGIQPAESVHLGHYFGAIRKQIEFHHEYPGQTFLFVADFHVLTRRKAAEVVHAGTLELATTYLALGLDPTKASIYKQSDVPAVTELAWILACFATVSELARLPTYKTTRNSEKQDDPTVSLGLLSYPVLMAADILGLRGTDVPVGRDQMPNVEKARDIAGRFNLAVERDLFPPPREVLASQAETVPGMDGQKMSSNYGNTIGLFEPFDVLRDKVMKIRTDSAGKDEPKDPDTCTVFTLYSLVAAPDEVEEMREKYRGGKIGYQDAKRELMLAIQEHFAPFQERYRHLKNEQDYVADILRDGFMHAREEIEALLDEVRSLVGLSAK